MRPRRSYASSFLLIDLLESRASVHGYVVRLVALDQILWFFLRGLDRVSLERD